MIDCPSRVMKGCFLAVHSKADNGAIRRVYKVKNIFVAIFGKKIHGNES